MTKEFTVDDLTTPEQRAEAARILLAGIDLRDVLYEDTPLGDLARQWCADQFSKNAAHNNLVGRLLEQMKEERDWR